jgi:hypothetical protein
MDTTLWEALEPLARWVRANQGKSFLVVGLAANHESITIPYIVHRRTRSTKRAAIYQRKMIAG